MWILSLATDCVWNTSSVVIFFLSPTKQKHQEVGPSPQFGNPYPPTTWLLCCGAYSRNRTWQLILCLIYFQFTTGRQIQPAQWGACHQTFNIIPALVVRVWLWLQQQWCRSLDLHLKCVNDPFKIGIFLFHWLGHCRDDVFFRGPYIDGSKMEIHVINPSSEIAIYWCCWDGESLCKISH